MKKAKENVNLLTAEGYEKIKKEIDYRETKLRDSLSETLDDMRNQGDVSENNGFSMAIEHNDQNEAEILRLKILLQNSKVIKRKSKTNVNIGSKVSVNYGNTGTKVYTIVGEDSANPSKNKISYKSPVGGALMQKKVGEKFILDTPRGKINCEIKAIN